MYTIEEEIANSVLKSVELCNSNSEYLKFVKQMYIAVNEGKFTLDDARHIGYAVMFLNEQLKGN